MSNFDNLICGYQSQIGRTHAVLTKKLMVVRVKYCVQELSFFHPFSYRGKFLGDKINSLMNFTLGWHHALVFVWLMVHSDGLNKWTPIQQYRTILLQENKQSTSYVRCFAANSTQERFREEQRTRKGHKQHLLKFPPALSRLGFI